LSIKGFSVGGVVQRYDYTALDNLPQGQGVSDDLKAALLQLAQKVAYIDDQGQTYYDDLYDALYPEKTLLSIAANFQQGQAVVYNTDSLDSLKQYLTVTATYDDASTETVPSSAYTLSGTLTTGTSVITVTYEGKTDAFNVVVTAAPIALTVTNNLTGCTTSNSATSVLENTSYTAVITASSGYTLVGATVSITMGGNDITTSAYSGGIITINSVTGALVISVAAVAVVLNSISAVYTQSGTVYDTDTLDSLKDDLVVTAHYSDSSTQTVPAADYTLSGTLTAGTSTITVAYGGKTTTFAVTVSSEQWDFEWDYTDGLPNDNGMELTNTGSNTISLASNGLSIATQNSSTSQVVYNYTSIGDLKTEVISELVFEITAFSTQSGSGVRDNASLGGAASDAKKCAQLCLSQNGIQYLGTASGWSTLSATPLSLNTEYAVRIDQTDGNADIYLNGTLVGSLENDFREPIGYAKFGVYRGVSALIKSYKLKMTA
jgi:hypothetical protein